MRPKNARLELYRYLSHTTKPDMAVVGRFLDQYKAEILREENNK